MAVSKGIRRKTEEGHSCEVVALVFFDIKLDKYVRLIEWSGIFGRPGVGGTELRGSYIPI